MCAIAARSIVGMAIPMELEGRRRFLPKRERWGLRATKLMKIISDFHSHVSRTSALQMVQTARDKGIKIFGLSEHDFQMSEIRPTLNHLPQEGIFMSLAEYVEGVQSAAQELQMDVRLGMEVD